MTKLMCECNPIQNKEVQLNKTPAWMSWLNWNFYRGLIHKNSGLKWQNKTIKNSMSHKPYKVVPNVLSCRGSLKICKASLFYQMLQMSSGIMILIRLMFIWTNIYKIIFYFPTKIFIGIILRTDTLNILEQHYLKSIRKITKLTIEVPTKYQEGYFYNFNK